MMRKTCFVIMGYGIKKGINLDLTYQKIIKPCIEENNLLPFPLYSEKKFNAYRSDEISGTMSIDYKFVTCLNESDIVIADISTMNVNAIYELGARHALKPKSTILLCAKQHENMISFLDIAYVPIISYDHGGDYIASEVVYDTKKQLNSFLNFSINDSSGLPDSPICRALDERKMYRTEYKTDDSIHDLYDKGRKELDNNQFDKANMTLAELYSKDSSEYNLILWACAKYKIAEQNNSCKGLIDCINLIKEKSDVDNSTNEYLLGRLAAISLRVYNISKDSDYYYSALGYYRKGAAYSKKNLYCPRNYCALLIQIYEISDDISVIKEYYYTAIHFAKLYVNMQTESIHNGSYEDRIYLNSNMNDLRAIIAGNYTNYEQQVSKIKKDTDISIRQKTTILQGILTLKMHIENIVNIINPS